MTFSSCLLQHRHWVIHAYNVVVSDVSGEAVIGMYPRFHPDTLLFRLHWTVIQNPATALGHWHPMVRGEGPRCS
ncbi:hypothetical protein WN943_016184 [Citrus x changshan-huyou]